MLYGAEACLGVGDYANLFIVFIFVECDLDGDQFFSHNDVRYVMARGVYIGGGGRGEWITAAPSRGLPFLRDPPRYIQASGLCTRCHICFLRWRGFWFEDRGSGCVSGGVLKELSQWLMVAWEGCWCLSGSHLRVV